MFIELFKYMLMRSNIAELVMYRCGQKVMSLINFLLSSHCTEDKDILPGDMIKLRVFHCMNFHIYEDFSL